MNYATDIAFVILHFNATADTVECVESIRSTHAGKNYHIVIVDNKSPNCSGAQLDDMYRADSDVTVILNDRNEGFARGNNVGFRYAKANLNPKYIVLLNNDTLILQEDFLWRVNDEYARSAFAVLGPVIETPGNFNNVNPLPSKERSLIYYMYLLAKFSAYYVIYTLWLGSVVDAFKVRCLGKPTVGDGRYRTDRAEDVKLHGCFLIFSQEYISRFDGLNDSTFLFMEEDLLYMRIRKSGLKSVYTPDIHIFHKEDTATNTITKKGNSWGRFRYKNHVKSTWAVIKEKLKH